jgi:hypothetical protein
MSRFTFLSPILLTAELSEAKRNFLAKQYKISPELVQTISEIDPSPKNAYSGWLIREFMRLSGSEAEKLQKLTGVTEALTRFVKLTNSPDFTGGKDILNYSYDSLMKLVGNDRKFRKNLSQAEIERKIMSEGLPGAELIWDGGGFKMWKVSNPKYAMFLSSNTKWCTAQERWANDYTNSGELYPIYYLGKPYAQGHIASQGESMALTLLDQQDKTLNVMDDTAQEMLETIKTPAMEMFKQQVYTTGYFRNVLQEVKGSFEDPKVQEEIKRYAMDSKNLGIIVATLAYFSWPEGWELILDYPNLLIRAMNDGGKIDELEPELQDEILESFDLKTYNSNTKIMSALVTIGRSEDILDYVLAQDQRALSGNTMMDIITDTAAKVWKEFLKNYIEGLTARMSRLEAHMQELCVDTPTLVAYWQKFINSPWDEAPPKLAFSPEYKEVVARYRAFPATLKVGDIVEVGPGSGWTPMGEGEVLEDMGETKYRVKFENMAHPIVIQYSKGSGGPSGLRGCQFDVIPVRLASKGKTTPVTAVFEVGAKVRRNPENWPKGYENQDKNENGELVEGTIISDASDSYGGYDWTVKWETDKDYTGGYLYKEGDLILVDPEPVVEPLPEKLAVGDRVKKGPTWNWNEDFENTSAEAGTVLMLDIAPSQGMEITAEAWILVNWDDQTEDFNSFADRRNDGTIPPNGNFYRYGKSASAKGAVLANVFYADVIPMDSDYEDCERKLVELNPENPDYGYGT